MSSELSQTCFSFTLSGTKCGRKAVNGSFCNIHQYSNIGPKKQCEAITKNGLRCSYNCKDGNLCNRHKHESKPKISKDKHCKGLNFNKQSFTLENCKKICSSEYCSTHKHKYRLEKPDECPICMELISETTEIPLECGHWIHKECLKLSGTRKCPVCRCCMKQKDIIYVFKTNINIQELQPVNDELFLNNINRLFYELERYRYLPVEYYDLSNVSYAEDNINLHSLSEIIDRDTSRYMVFLQSFINIVINEHTPSYLNEEYIYGLCVYIRDKIMDNISDSRMKELFNCVNYDMYHNNDTVTAIFESMIQSWIQNYQN